MTPKKRVDLFIILSQCLHILSINEDQAIMLKFKKGYVTWSKTM